MNSLIYYTRQKDVWSNSEVEELTNEYNSDELTISEIGDIHRRTPGSISYKLKCLGIIENNTEARGYLNYKSSDLYKEIVALGNTYDRKKGSNNEYTKDMPNINITMPNMSELVNVQYDIKKLKNNMKIMKNDITEILRIVNILNTPK